MLRACAGCALHVISASTMNYWGSNTDTEATVMEEWDLDVDLGIEKGASGI